MNSLRQTTPRQVYKHPVYVELNITYGEIKRKITKYETRLVEKEDRITKLIRNCQKLEYENALLSVENSISRNKLKRKYDECRESIPCVYAYIRSRVNTC